MFLINLDRMPQYFFRNALITITLCAMIPIGCAVLFNLYLDPYLWKNEPVHSLIEAIGAFTAILLAIFIIMLRSNDQFRTYYLWIATTLIGMGLLDTFQASVISCETLVWLHSLAILIGGLIFAVNLLPEFISKRAKLSFSPYAVVFLAIVLGVGSILYPELIPQMVHQGEFTLLAKLLNLIGGLGFIFAWFYFLNTQKIKDQKERILLASYCLLFGMAGLLFSFSTLWDATWWLWHILRLLAYLIILWFFFAIYLNHVKKTLNEKEAILLNYSKELDKERQQLNDIIGNSPSLIALKDLSGLFVIANKQFYKLLELTPEKVIGKSADSIFHGTCFDAETELEQIVIDERKVLETESLFSLNGEERSFITSRFPLINNQDQLYGIGYVLTEITERKAMEMRLRLAQQIIDTTSEGIVVTNKDGRIIEVNNSYTRITGYSREELINNKPSLLKSGKQDHKFYQDMWQKINSTGHWQGEIWDQRKNGEIFPKRLTINSIKDDDGSTMNYVGLFNDITMQKRTEEALENLAYHDALTQLPNRVLFKDRLHQGIANAKREKSLLGILLIDLDRFKFVNDTLGHDAGDELLQLVSNQLLSVVRESDTVARLGGDEFVVILPDIHSPEAAAHVAQNIINTLRNPYRLRENSVNIGASIGISIYPNNGQKVDILVKQADLALYKAKDLGKNNYQFFSQDLQEAILIQAELEKELRKAIIEEQFTLYYQPKIDLATKKIVGMEALVRWIHPEKGLVLPEDFIPFAEESGLIFPMGDWILRTACRQASEWITQFNKPLIVAINLSTKQFKQPDLVETIQNLLQEFNLQPECLELEITESCVMHDVERALTIMHSFRNLGIKLAIDDFGTGYSSLSYLKRFPINTLKIDQSFVRDLTIDTDDSAIIEAVISLAEKLKLDVVAEGVETQVQLEFLTEKGCQNVQGYFVSRPLTHEEFGKYITQV